MADTDTETVAVAELRRLIERIENIEAEIDNQKDDRKDVYMEAKAGGFDTKTMRTIIALRKMDKDKRDEAQAMLDTYMQALGLA